MCERLRIMVFWINGRCIARNVGGFVAGAAPDTDPQVPAERGHRPLVSNLHVGRDLPAQCGSAPLVRYRRQTLRNSARLVKLSSALPFRPPFSFSLFALPFPPCIRVVLI